jgi:antagonist of KipI
MSTRTIEVISSGLLTTVQDLGRQGYQRYGIPVCGALDPVSLRIANILVGNAEGEAGLEITALGPTIRFASDGVFAVVGASFRPELDGREVQTWESVKVSAGSVLSLGAASDGLRAYVAVAGGIGVPVVMNSRSTDLKGGFGGFEGRALRDGDSLAVGDSPHVSDWSQTGLPAGISRQPTFGQEFEIRVVLGPQDGEFTESGVKAMLTSEYTVSVDSDRMGCRLEGAEIGHRSGPDIVSDGTALGSIQVPGSGQPIILLTDRGTTGGYAKIATVIGPDIGLLTQAMPGAKVRFSEVSVDEAHQILRDQEEMLREIKSFVGLDLTGAVSIRSDDSDVQVRDENGDPIAVTEVRGSRMSTRTVSANIDGEQFEFELRTAFQ